MFRTERVLMNYGEVRERVVDALKSRTECSMKKSRIFPEAVMFRALYITIPLFLFIFITLACDKKHNPVNSPIVTYSITGSVKDMGGSGAGGSHVHLTSTSIDTTATSEPDGTYRFTCLPSGMYTIEVSTDGYLAGPKSQQINLKGDAIASEVILVPEAYFDGRYCICGKITTDDNSPVISAIVTVSGEGLSETIIASQTGYYSKFVPRGKRILVTLSKKGYAFTFNPPNIDVLPQDEITICNFIAVNNGPPLHSISGKTVDRSGEGVECLVMLFNENDRGDYCGYNVSSNGVFTFPNIKDGKYHISFIKNFSATTVEFTLEGHDIILTDIVGKYMGLTKYIVSGRIVDRNGNGIPGAQVTFTARSNSDMTIRNTGEMTTVSDGSYQSIENVGSERKFDVLTYTLKPHKEGFLFTPDTTSVTLSRVDDVRDGGTVTVPDFVGSDYTIYTASDYFYLSPTASWTYERTVDGGPAEEYKVSITGFTTLDGRVYRIFAPAGPGGMTAFRIDGNSAYAIFESGRTEFLKFAVAPGKTWGVGTTSGGYPVNGTFLGVETISTPAGAFAECLKYEVRTVYGQTSYQAYTLWFAKGSGMVRGERVLVNYGEVREHVFDALKSRTE
jgi:hypothetical protein